MSEAARLLRFLAAGLLHTGFGHAGYAAFHATGLPLWRAVAAIGCLGRRRYVLRAAPAPGAAA